MSSSIFVTLPPELICQIFEATDDFDAVSALARTARVFYHTWRENPTSICRAVGRRVVPSFMFKEAEKLLDVQEEEEAMNKLQDSPKNEPKSITRAKRFVFHARKTYTYDNWFACPWGTTRSMNRVSLSVQISSLPYGPLNFQGEDTASTRGQGRGVFRWV